MWVKTDVCVVYAKCMKIFGDQIVIPHKDQLFVQYRDKGECEKVLSMFADAIIDGSPLFEMPTQEQLDSEEANSDPLIKTFKGGSQVQNGSASVQKAIELWNNLEQYGFKPVSRISNSSTRYKSLAARLREYSIEEYAKAIENIKKSELLRKNADSWFNFDWFIKKNNFPKVLDGNYNSSTDRIGEEEKGWWKD